MKLMTSVKHIVFNLPPEFDKIARILPLCSLLPNEKILFEYACILVINQLQHDEITPPDIPTNIFFLDSDTISFQFTPNQMGAYFLGIYYPVYKWRDAHLSDQQIITCMVEEMCHVFWCIRDESLVNYKVLEVLRKDYPTLNLEDLYPYTRKQ